MKGNRNRDGRPLGPLLHDPVAASLADRSESMMFEDLTDL